eukprot:12796-Heterococcus_DN1.PRE.3
MPSAIAVPVLVVLVVLVVLAAASSLGSYLHFAVLCCARAATVTNRSQTSSSRLLTSLLRASTER